MSVVKVGAGSGVALVEIDTEIKEVELQVDGAFVEITILVSETTMQFDKAFIEPEVNN